MTTKKGKKFRKKSRTAEIYLKKLAKVLDDLDKHDVDFKMTHGIVVSKYGYVMPRKRGWVVRMLDDRYQLSGDDED
jgi:predicted acetyltransferase